MRLQAEMPLKILKKIGGLQSCVVLGSRAPSDPAGSHILWSAAASASPCAYEAQVLFRSAW